jgi:hypothetical protein
MGHEDTLRLDEDTLYYWAGQYRLAIENLKYYPEDARTDIDVKNCESQMRRHLNNDRGVIERTFGPGVR